MDLVMEDQILPNYICPLKAEFKEAYNTRSVDRALWVYGHLFQQK